MHFVVSTTITAALAMAPQVSAHCKIISAWGDNNRAQGSRGTGMCVDPAIPLGQGTQNPFQYDVTVFSDPIVPPGPGHPNWGKRHWVSEGCGATISTLNRYHSKADPKNWATASDYQKNWWWYMGFIPSGAPEAFVQTLSETTNAVNSGHVPQCNVGGWLRMMVYQVNDDGAGPFRCRIDKDGNGKYGDWLYINPGENPPPGDVNQKSVYAWGNYQQHPLVANIPLNQECNIQIGKMKNICIMRCENFAANGPFGGCVPFQLMNGPQKPTVTQKPPAVITKAVPGNAGYNVNDNSYKENAYYKRDTEQKNTRRAIIANGTNGTTSE
ncbi:hypothetical protein TWF694_005114 [Orbilia ellipsospora]|uniref:Uncharacterized protein n=1 Tax=Orbilia ellipsospora TaxID=2528407 RepID=A0AAV9WVX1_9PEZI